MSTWPDPNATRAAVDAFLGKPSVDAPPSPLPIDCLVCHDEGGCPCGGDNPDCEQCDGSGMCPGCGG